MTRIEDAITKTFSVKMATETIVETRNSDIRIDDTIVRAIKAKLHTPFTFVVTKPQVIFSLKIDARELISINHYLRDQKIVEIEILHRKGSFLFDAMAIFLPVLDANTEEYGIVFLVHENKFLRSV